MAPRTATIPATDENQRRFESAIRKLDRMIDRGSKYKDVAIAAKFALTTLRENGINAKVGGSLAAYIYDAERPPGDVDIELESSADFNAAYDLLAGMEKRRFHGKNIRLSKGEFTEGKAGMVEVELRGEGLGRKTVIDLDLVNENHPSMNRYVKSPHRTGSPPVGLSSEWRLIVNYIDRRLGKSDLSLKKNDAEQVYDIITRGNYDPATIKDEIYSRVQTGYRTEFMDTFDLMMSEARAERAEHAERTEDPAPAARAEDPAPAAPAKDAETAARRNDPQRLVRRKRKDSGCTIG